MFPYFLFLLVVASGPTNATLRRVPADYNSIQSAILASQHSDTVLVAEGTYVENIDFRGRNIVVGSYFLADSDAAHIPLTVIDGSQPEHADSGSVVRIINGEDSTAALIGFTITGGTGTKFQDQDDNLFYLEGGGIIIENSDPLIAYNFIVHNEATRQPTGTQSAGGGGIRYGYCSPKIYNNIILQNSGKYGGGVVSFFADGNLQHNVIANNDGGQAYGGGGMWIGGAGHTTTLINNTIVRNESVLSGGGVRLFGGFLNGHGNIVWGNHANSGSNQISANEDYLIFDYSCIEGGLGGNGNIDLYPQFLEQNLRLGPASPCVDTGHPDPQWNDEDGTRNDMGCYGGPGASWFAEFGEPKLDFYPRRFELRPFYSEAWIDVRNTGISNLEINEMALSVGIYVELLTTSLSIAPFQTGTIMVATSDSLPIERVYDELTVFHNAFSFENPYLLEVVYDPSWGAASDALILDFALHAAYPNPFNPSTTIAFALPSEQLVNLAITDIQGREVAQLVNSRLAAGEHVVEWNASQFASGTYFASLHAGKWQAQTKLLLTK